MQWLKVILAGIIEVIWVTGLNIADSTFAWIIVILVIGLSFYLVISACKSLPVGTVYAIFVGLGTVGTVLVEMVLFNNPFNFTKMVFIIILIIGIIGLKLSTEEEGET